ncbi:hypothetical protein [Circovirus-like genome RW-B]|uniref:hypothetical protein n=1 Tax=Circovirus-like genome RW-B TaxID=642252 RepID=UPI0001AE5DB5|nr:hypothetical protein [Circovirus-like genome RW-B]ACQ78159.1 hypothetical protein [Circovirus-like genome RW-B]
MSKRTNPYQRASLPPKKRYRADQQPAIPRLRLPYHLGGPLYVSRPLPMARRGAPTGRYASNPRMGELKTVDYQFSAAYAVPYVGDSQPFPLLNCTNATGNIQCVNLVQQGTGVAQRIGNKICMRSLRIRLRFVEAGTDDNQAPYFARIMLIYDRNPNSLYIATNNILANALQNNTLGNGTLDSSLNPTYYDRFVVLRDWYQTIPTFQESTSNVAPNWIIDDFVNLKNLETTYNGTANPMTINQVSVGALLLFVISDQVAATSDAVALGGNLRLRFHDQ